MYLFGAGRLLMTVAEQAAPVAEEAQGKGAYKWVVLLILTLAYVISMLDRQLPFILAESIKQDLSLTDTQLGLLGGVLFAAFYSTCGIPMARLADLYPRKLILSGAIAFWCSMTALGGLATHFWHLAATRVGLAVGEAACTPAAHSMIADYFPLSRRATAIAIFSIGGPIGSMLGLLLGGWISDVTDWRTAFFAIGIPGVLLALVTLLVLREPRRGAMDVAPVADPNLIDAPIEDEKPPKFFSTIKLLWSRRSFRHMALGGGLYGFGAAAKVAFGPAYLMRSHELSASETGALLGLVVGISGIVGTLAGGFLGDILGRLDKRWYMWLPGISLLLAAPCLAIAFLAPNALVALIFLVPSYGLGILFIAPTFAMVQALVPSRSRAMAAAVMMACLYIIGNSFGPTVVGAISDFLKPTAGADSLGWALALTSITNVWAFIHYLRAAHFLREDLQRAKV